MGDPNLIYGVIIFGVGLAVLVFLSVSILKAGRLSGASSVRTAVWLVAGLWLWAASANAYALITGPEFYWFAPAILMPIVGGTALTFLPAVAELLRHISIVRLVGVQIYRNAGAVFLLAHFAFDHPMSRQFALTAGWGDVLTGTLAIPVAAAAYWRVRYWQGLVVVWCCIGTADLLIAPMMARIYGAMGADDIPINAIPLFFGPPLGILLHIIALRALWLQHKQDA